MTFLSVTQYSVGSDTYTEGTTRGTVASAVRNDELKTLAGTTNELAPVQVDSLGCLKTSQAVYKPFERTANLGGTTLNGQLGQGTTGLVTLTSSADFDASTGYVRIEDEVIAYDLSGVGANQINVTARGEFGTDDVAHADATSVGELYDSGVLTLDSWTQVITKITSDEDCSLLFIWYSDAAGNDEIRRLTPSFVSGNGYDYLSAPAFGPYVRYTIAPSTGTTTGNVYFTTEFSRQSVHPQLFTLQSGVFSSMISMLSRSVLVAQQLSTDAYQNVRSTQRNELLTNTLASNRAVTVSTRQTVGNATSWFMLVDLSDTTTFPHNETTGLVLDFVSYSILANANSDGNLDIGVVTEVDDVDGSASFVYHRDWVGESGGGAGAQIYEGGINFAPNSIDCTIDNGAGTKFLSSESVAADSALQTDVALSGVASSAPGVGDLVMRVVNDDVSNALVSITVGYHSV